MYDQRKISKTIAAQGSKRIAFLKKIQYMKLLVI